MKNWMLAACASVLAVAVNAAPEWTKAVVMKAEPERSRVILKHETIKSIDMEPMTMPFKVARSVDLKRFKAGDKVRFTVSNKDDHLLVEAMEKLK